MLPDAWQSVGRLLVVQTDDAQDVSHAGPALQALRAALPLATITLLATPSGAVRGALLPGVDDVLAWDAVWQTGGPPEADDPARSRALIEALRDRRFDAAVILPARGHSPHAAGYACYLAGIPIRLGQSREFGGAVLQPAIQAPAEGDDPAEAGLALLRAAGLLPAADAEMEGEGR